MDNQRPEYVPPKIDTQALLNEVLCQNRMIITQNNLVLQANALVLKYLSQPAYVIPMKPNKKEVPIGICSECSQRIEKHLPSCSRYKLMENEQND